MLNVPSHIGIVIDKYSNKDFSDKNILSFVRDIYNICLDIGTKEITFYGIDNYEEELAVIISYELFKLGSRLLVLGNTESAKFPYELLCFAQKRSIGGGIKVNFLVNYSIEWDLENNISMYYYESRNEDALTSINVISVWGEVNNVGKFLPMQTSTANLYFQRKSYYKFQPSHIYDALMLNK